MNVNVLQSRNPYANNLNNANNKVKSIDLNKVNQQKEISNSEMKYFQKLFPENAKQIEKYLAFNKNGQITETNLSKGSIIDGRI